MTDATSDTPQTAIALTDKAAGKIAELLGSQEGSEDQALRVAVRGGGCSGFQYALAFDRAKDDDHVFEVDGVSVIVDKVSMQFVFGSEVDYVEGLQGAGFQVNNPNVVAACGCGSSFQVKDDAPAAETAAVLVRPAHEELNASIREAILRRSSEGAPALISRPLINFHEWEGSFGVFVGLQRQLHAWWWLGSWQVAAAAALAR